MTGPTAAVSPVLSAVVCTYNRAPLLARALGALCGQTMERESFEVIVVDDGSSDETRQVAEAFHSLLPLRYAFQTNSGLASGKNHGLFLARGEIVLFLDDDDVADSRLLEEHQRSHVDFPQEQFAVLGYTDLTAAVARSPLMYFVTQVGCHLFSYPTLSQGDVLDYTYFWGGRSSCKRMFLLEHGVFDPVFRFGAEDIELGYRLSKKGLKVVYNRNAASHMVRELEFDGFCRRCYLQGRSNWVFSQRHPNAEVRKVTQVDGAADEWARIRPRYDLLMKMAQDMDRLAAEASKAGRPLDNAAKQLLFKAYRAAFTASRIKGTVSIQSEPGAS